MFGNSVGVVGTVGVETANEEEDGDGSGFGSVGGSADVCFDLRSGFFSYAIDVGD